MSTSNSVPTILAVGAAGKFAGLVVPELAKRGARVRGMIQNPKQGELVRKNGAAEVAVADLTDRASLDAALRGVDSVFYIAPAFLPDEAAVGMGMVTAAKQAGVRRFVFSSVIDPILSVLVNHAAKGPVEEAVLASDMEYTFLHPALFFQNFAQGWPAVVKTGAYAEPWSADTRISRVDYRDVAEAAAIALMEDRLLYGAFELCAAGDLNRREVATLMGEVLGCTVEAASLSAEKIAKVSKGEGDPKQASPMQAMFDYYDAHSLRGNALVLRSVLGREPRTLRAYFEGLAALPESGAEAVIGASTVVKAA